MAFEKFSPPPPPLENIPIKVTIKGKIKGVFSRISKDGKEEYHGEDELESKPKNDFDEYARIGKETANSAMEGIRNMPLVGKAIGKMEIAYNQHWINKHEEFAASQLEKLKGVDTTLNSLDKSKTTLNKRLKFMEAKNMPGQTIVAARLRSIEKSRFDLMKKKDDVSSLLEYKENRIKDHTNRRDKVADRFIEQFDTELKPIEEKLKGLNKDRNRVELHVAVAEAKHLEQTEKADKLEKETKELKAELLDEGFSESDIEIFTQDAVITLKEARERIEVEKVGLQKQKENINKKIAEVEARANPYRDKKNKFIRIKEGRPTDLKLENRPSLQNKKYFEESSFRPRYENFFDIDDSEDEDEPELDEDDEEDLEELEKRGKYKVEALIEKWNEMVEPDNIDHKIEADKFFSDTSLDRNSSLKLDNFKEILNRYYSYNDKDVMDLEDKLKEFIAKIKDGDIVVHKK